MHRTLSDAPRAAAAGSHGASNGNVRSNRSCETSTTGTPFRSAHRRTVGSQALSCSSITSGAAWSSAVASTPGRITSR